MTTQRPDPPICDARRCRWCRRGDPPRPVPLTTLDLAWYFGESESAMGVSSTLGAFVAMAMSGIGGGGKQNGVEARAVEPWRLAATARHRCIRTRLAHVPPAQLEVLRVAYAPDDWTRAITDPQVRDAVQRAIRARADLATGKVLPLAGPALEHAARRQAAPAPPPKPRKSRPAAPGAAPLDTLADKVRRTLAEPGVAGSAIGYAVSASCSQDGRLVALAKAAAELVSAARAAAGIVEPQVPRRTRSVQLVPRPKAAPPPEPEEYLGRQHAEALAGG